VGGQNAETVEAFYEALNRGDVDEALEMLDPEVVGDFSRSINPDVKGVYRGREEIRGFYEGFMDAWQEFEWVAEEHAELGDHVLRIGGIRARGRGSGVEVAATGAQVWTFRDGRPVAMALFQSKADALEHIEAE
jgi:ketosteroid isomerase-like protein